MRARPRLTARAVRQFQDTILAYYRDHQRVFSWRKTRDPYKILVSEIMLQQTQVQRVVKKYDLFINKFPTVSSLYRATLQEVLSVWQGLGYNRRALALKKIAALIVNEHRGKVPGSIEILKTFPGIGHATASAVCAFAFDQPAAFIETNIRSVYIHYFFKDLHDVSDKELMRVVERTVETGDPRRWYYALMDYGVFLKVKSNPNLQSAHYRTQSPFSGSPRQLRGRIIAQLVSGTSLSQDRLYAALRTHMATTQTKKTFSSCVKQLLTEGLIKKRGNKLSLD